MSAKERREREKEQRKEQILSAARTLLIEKGLSAASINQIAKRAELSVGAIYFYYKNKEELYAALQMEGLALLLQMNREAIEGKSLAEEKIRSIALAYLRFSEEHKSYFDILNYFLAAPEQLLSAEMKNQVDDRGLDNLIVLADVIDEGIREGLFKSVKPKRQAIILWGTLLGLIQFKKLEKTSLSNENHQSIYLEATEQFIDGLRKR
jgi:TetR/AcrR family transcriptional regulator